MEEILVLKIGIAILGAIIFAFYDIFNKRTIPDKVAYSFFALSLILTFFNNLETIEVSLIVAFAILGFGYLLYKEALLGLGDVIELASLSLLLPYFPPLYPSQLEAFARIPFFVALFLNSGVFAVFLVSIYLPFKIKKIERGDRRTTMLAILLFVLYLLVAFLLSNMLSIFGIAFIALLGVCASILMIYSKDFKEGALKEVSIKELEIGDIIKPIPEKEINEKLVTKQLIQKLQKKRIRKVMVYYNLPPFSLFILFGLIAGILFGNILLWVARI